jgi:hypothetical protein
MPQQPPPAPRTTSSADLFIIICLLAMVIGFMGLSWIQTSTGGGGLTGLRLLSGVPASDLPSAIQQPPPMALPFVLVAIGGSFICLFLGMVLPRWKVVFAFLILMFGLIGLAYFGLFITYNQANFNIVGTYIGLGFLLALVANIGLLIQIFLPRRPRVRRRGPRNG